MLGITRCGRLKIVAMVEPRRRFSVSGRDRSGTAYVVAMADAEMARRHAKGWLEIGFTEVTIVDHLTGMEIPLQPED
jgi:hypothetical protein